MIIPKVIFFLSLLMVFYIYLGYPLAIFFLSIFLNKKVNKGNYEPNVSIVIAAYNEEEYIEATLKNKLELEYPREKVEVIVISDASTDGTDEIIKKYESQRVRLLRQEPRSGKTSALNMAVSEAKGEIIVFSSFPNIPSSPA